VCAALWSVEAQQAWLLCHTGIAWFMGVLQRLPARAPRPGGRPCQHVPESVGAMARRFDLDLGSEPYKVMKHHTAAVRGVAYHRTYPLFASVGDDACVHVFHGMVYSDLLTNPLIVPVKLLTAHSVRNHAGVLDVCFHPSQPWLFTAGADEKACLFVDV
jgi:WD40 repeat protein